MKSNKIPAYPILPLYIFFRALYTIMHTFSFYVREYIQNLLGTYTTNCGSCPPYLRDVSLLHIPDLVQ